MKKAKISLSLSKLNDGQLEIQAQAIAAAMNGNKNFTESTALTADLNNSIQLYSDSLSLAKSRDLVKVALKNQRKEELRDVLVRLGNYCTHIADGDRAILSSSGFPLRAEVIAARTLAQPENFTVVLGNNSGEAMMYINKVPYAKSYLFLYAVSPVSNESWFHEANSQPWFMITGLTPGATYSFKIGVIGAKGQTTYTEVISKMVV